MNCFIKLAKDYLEKLNNLLEKDEDSDIILVDKLIENLIIMKKINIAELLKDCPQGMELYSPLCGDCKLYSVNDYNITIEIPNRDSLIILRHDGTYCVNGEIMLFPKGKTTWEGFVPPYEFKKESEDERIRKKVAIVGDINYKNTIKTFLTSEGAYGNGLLCSNETRIYYVNDDKYLTCGILNDVNNYREFIIIRVSQLIEYIAKGYTLSGLTKHLNKEYNMDKLKENEVYDIDPIDVEPLNLEIDCSNTDIETFKSITKEMSELYAKKNADYGNSFDKGMDTIGMAYGVGRMYDKMNRIINLTKGHEAKVIDEKLEDTVLDLANYSVMLLSYLKRNGKKL